MSHPDTRSPLAAERLEARDLASAGQWLVEPFQRGPNAGLPNGWTQWSSDGRPGYAIDPAQAGLGDSGRLHSNPATSAATSRAWVSAPFAADVETSAAVFLNSAVPVQLLVRGQNLGTAAPSYYAAAVVRGGEAQLVRVSGGGTTVLGTVKAADWLSNKWATVTVRADGDRISVSVFRGDTSQYLGADGQWGRRPVSAIAVTDAGVRGAGAVGFARPAGAAGAVALDSLRVDPADAPTRATLVEDRFVGGAANGLPPGWTGWASGGGSGFRTAGDDTLRLDAPSGVAARAWFHRALPADTQVSSSVYVDSLTEAGLIARGTNLHTTRPTYYGLTVSRGLGVELKRVVNGVETSLGRLQSKDWVSGQWVQASLILKGSDLRVQVFRSDTGQYLNADGTWGLSPAWAMARSDTAITDGERVGLSRGAGYAGPLVFDNVIVTAAPERVFKADPIPTERDKATTPTTPKPPEDPAPVPTPAPTPVPPTPAPTGRPVVPRHYSHIRLANLAYHGTPFGEFETNLLKNSIDLVIPNSAYLDRIAGVSPTTPQFLYTNVSNIYLSLYTDWNEYADRNKLDRESAFYHVTKPTAYSGKSASAVPVNQLWGVYRGADAAWENVTRSAQRNEASLAFGGAGQAVALGYTERFRELNFDLKSFAGGSWRGQFEYVAAVDAQGRPTRWAPLALLADGTGGFKRDGRITFDPPRDWVPASVGGSARLYYVRVKTAAAGTAPVANTVTGRDYVNDKGGAAGGTIPAFDYAADKDRDGYLNDREYAARKGGFDARFAYEDRLFYPNYGSLRFATNVADPAFRAWAGDYHARLLAGQPKVAGFFVDNSVGKLAVDPTGLKESLDGYAEQYGSLLGAVDRRIGDKWLIANTSGAGVAAEPIARAGVAYLEEFGLRPVSTNHVQFDDLLATLTNRRRLSGGTAYEVLDSLIQGMDANAPRAQLSALAMYYAVADPDLSMLMLNGGNEPNSGWNRHWTDAARFNVGRPTGTAAVVAQGTDPTDRTLAYKVYGRTYQNALVLYKPLSYTRGRAGTAADATATTHQLDGSYRPVRADGTLGPAVTRVTLRNGEGVVLAKA